MSIFTGLIGQWLLRRAMELGGIFVTLASLYQALPPASQQAIGRIFQGDWQNVSLGAVVGVIVAVWGYVWSLRSTIRPQVVTADAKQIPLTPTGAAEAEAVARLAPKPRTLWDRLTGK